MFSFGSKKFLGIDIGTYSIKIVELKKIGNKYELENYGEINTSLVRQAFSSIRKEEFVLSNETVVQSISSICKEMKTRTKEINFSIPDFCTFFTNLKIPKMKKEKISEAIKYEIRPYIPISLSELTLDWIITNEKETGNVFEILAVAIPNDIISQYQQIAYASGLKLRVLEPEVFALGRSAFWNNSKGLIGLIDIGSRSTTASIMEEGVLKISYSFNIAGNELTTVLAKSMNIDYNKAESLKKNIGIKESSLSDSYSKQIATILSSSVDLILEEIKKVFRTFYQQKGKEVEKVILSGGTSWLPGISEYFQNVLKKEIQILNPFINIAHKPILDEILKKRGPFYAVATGLAMKGLE